MIYKTEEQRHLANALGQPMWGTFYKFSSFEFWAHIAIVDDHDGRRGPEQSGKPIENSSKLRVRACIVVIVLESSAALTEPQTDDESQMMTIDQQPSTYLMSMPTL